MQVLFANEERDFFFKHLLYFLIFFIIQKILLYHLRCFVDLPKLNRMKQFSKYSNFQIPQEI